MTPRELKFFVLDADHQVQPQTPQTPWRGTEQIAFNEFGHEAIGVISVSTIFLGIGLPRHDGGLAPLFETMIFGCDGEGLGDLNGYQRRCVTYDEAMAMHAQAVEHVKNAFSELAKASGA